MWPEQTIASVANCLEEKNSNFPTQKTQVVLLVSERKAINIGVRNPIRGTAEKEYRTRIVLLSNAQSWKTE